MKVEAILTCVGADSLRMFKFTSFYSLSLFDNFIVSTTPDDLDTQQFCKERKIDCVVTDLFTKNGAKFNKGGGINESIKRLKYNDYICHLDGDIVIKPSNFRYILERECQDKELFYGCRRIMVDNWKQFNQILTEELDDSKLLTYPGVGFGYFQLWHYNSLPMRLGYRYPDSYGTGESDWQWRNLWGDLKNADTETTGKLRKLSFDVWHLGNPGVWNSKSFWE